MVDTLLALYADELNMFCVTCMVGVIQLVLVSCMHRMSASKSSTPCVSAFHQSACCSVFNVFTLHEIMCNWLVLLLVLMVTSSPQWLLVLSQISACW